MKSPAPDNAWAATQLNHYPLGGILGAWGGISGTMGVDGQQAYVHCGGYNEFADEDSTDCFLLRVGSSGEVVMDSLAPLPQKL